LEYKQIHTWKGTDKSAAADGSPKQKAILSMREHEKDDQKGQGQRFMNAVAQMLLTALCHARKYLKESCWAQEGICACLFTAGPVDIRPAIEIGAWQAVWRHHNWTLWRHKCMFQAPGFPKGEMANFRKTFHHHQDD
jgi:hypothetical protein